MCLKFSAKVKCTKYICSERQLVEMGWHFRFHTESITRRALQSLSDCLFYKQRMILNSQLGPISTDSIFTTDVSKVGNFILKIFAKINESQKFSWLNNKYKSQKIVKESRILYIWSNWEWSIGHRGGDFVYLSSGAYDLTLHGVTYIYAPVSNRPPTDLKEYLLSFACIGLA